MYEHLSSVPYKDFQGICFQESLSEVLYSVLTRGTIHVKGGPSTAAMDGPAGQLRRRTIYGVTVPHSLRIAQNKLGLDEVTS